jgi:hypothetical protein
MAPLESRLQCLFLTISRLPNFDIVAQSYDKMKKIL